MKYIIWTHIYISPISSTTNLILGTLAANFVHVCAPLTVNSNLAV